MYAIVKDGGHQYKCEIGSKMFLDLRGVDDGATIELDEVLLISNEDGVVIGQPTIPGAKVVCTVMTRPRVPSSSCVGSDDARTAAKRRGTVKRTSKSKLRKSSVELIST